MNHRVTGTSELNVDGISVHVTRKAIRNVYLRVKPPEGQVTVSAPARMQDSDIRRFVLLRKSWITQQQARIKAAKPAAQSTTQAALAEAEARIHAQLPALLAHWEPIVGRSPTHITLRRMTSRWGSCTPATGRIRLNLQLGLMEPKFLEYVLVHELTHLWENGHGARFQRRMDSYLPDWRERRHELNQQVVW